RVGQGAGAAESITRPAWQLAAADRRLSAAGLVDAGKLEIAAVRQPYRETGSCNCRGTLANASPRHLQFSQVSQSHNKLAVTRMHFEYCVGSRGITCLERSRGPPGSGHQHLVA